MQIICSKQCGFCSGVNYCVNKTLELLQSNKKNIYCIGQLVHNENVIDKLENKGLVIVNSIDDVPRNSVLIIRAHGAEKSIIDTAKEKNIEVIDLTCGKIKIILNKIQKQKNKSFIVIIGKKNHPEPLGILSYIENNCDIIEDLEDIPRVCKEIHKSSLNNVYVVSQTTFSDTKFDVLTKELKKYFDDNINIVIDKTICDVTKKRQIEAINLSKSVDKMIVIGGKNSSNTKELYKIASTYCSKSYLIQTVEDLKDEKFYKTDKVGILSGTSTHKDNINEIIEYLKN